MVSVSEPVGLGLVYSGGIGFRWKQRWFICNSRRLYLRCKGADADRWVDGVVGALGVTYTCP